MFAWFKKLFPSPKMIIRIAVDSLDMAVPYMATELDKAKSKFNEMNSTEKAQLVIDKIQVFLRKQFKLETDA